MIEKNLTDEEVETFAQAICKVKGWTRDPYYKTLIDAIKLGYWNDKLEFWIAGRQSVLDELTLSGMGTFVESKK